MTSSASRAVASVLPGEDPWDVARTSALQMPAERTASDRVLQASSANGNFGLAGLVLRIIAGPDYAPRSFPKSVANIS
jgi:hypothetical protein